MNKLRSGQKGLALSQLFIWGVVLGSIAVVAMKAVPSFVTYQSVLTAVKRIASEAGPQGTVGEIKVKFSKQMEVEHIKTITADDLDIYKENGMVVISFSFSDKIKLVGPVSLVIDYNGSTKAVE